MTVLSSRPARSKSLTTGEVQTQLEELVMYEPLVTGYLKALRQFGHIEDFIMRLYSDGIWVHLLLGGGRTGAITIKYK